MKNARLIFVALLLAGVAILSSIVYKGEVRRREYKEDLVELTKIKYGLFSVDNWKSILEDILSKKIVEFNFEELPKEKIRKKISDLLYKITGDLQSSFKEEKGFLPRAVANITGIFDKIEDDVPQFTESIMVFIEDPQNRESLKLFALNKLDEMTSNTFSEIDYTDFDRIIEKYDCQSPEVVIANLNSKIESTDRENHPYRIAIFFLAGVTAMFLLFGNRLSRHEFFLLCLICFCFLMTGLALPMIEIDARISEMRFALLGETILFNDQILYYKNKSILEVVQVMIMNNRLDLIVVGALVLLFSVVFPLAKLISSVFYVYFEKVRRSGFMKFIVFKTGKWSMADVMVLAIFMAFIGFSGILREQLQQLEIMSKNLDLFTTNASRLQVGFYLFTSFVVLSLLIAHKLQYEFKRDKKEVIEEQFDHQQRKEMKERAKKPSPATDTP